MYTSNMKNTKKGFTLIETVVALAIFTIIAFSGTTLLIYSSEVSEKIGLKNELLENARITLNFMMDQIRMSEGYDLRTDADDTLIRLRCYKSSGDESLFAFDKSLSSDAARYGQVTFGGNELSSYIADVKMKVDGNRMEIRIITKSKISQNSSIEVEPIEIVGKVSLRYKYS